MRIYTMTTGKVFMIESVEIVEASSNVWHKNSCIHIIKMIADKFSVHLRCSAN